MTEKELDQIKAAMRQVGGEIKTTMMAKIAKESAKEAVTEMLLVCGIDYSNPVEMQELMAFAKECKKEAPRNKKVMEWARESMDTGKVFKGSLIGELGKFSAHAILILGVVWFLLIGDK